MTPKEIEALFGPAPQAAAPAAAAPAQPATASDLTPEQLFGPAPVQPTMPPPSAAAASPVPQTPAVTVPSPDAPGATAEVPPSAPSTEPSLGPRIASDIGTGITELPRAALKGARDAAQETLQFGVDAGNWVGQQQDKLVGLFGGTPGKDVTAPTLPDLKPPESVTGKLATSVSQFITGMVGLGKIAKPLEAAGGLAKAGRAAKVVVESAKAATVGAVAFDPSSERLSNIIESVPTLSNPVSQFLQAQPGDSKALGRVKNALESIGMDAALVGSLVAGTKAYRAVAEWKAGRATAEEAQKAIAEAQRAELNGTHAAETPTASEPQGTLPKGEPSAPAGGDTAAPVPAGGDLPAQPGAAGVVGPKAEAGTAPDAVALKAADQASPEVLSVQRVDTVPADAPAAPKFTEITDEQVASILSSTKADVDAYVAAGGWTEAVSEGHVFGRGERIPWQRLLAKTDVPAGGEAPQLPMSAFMARVADSIEADINKARGGNAEGVLTDQAVDAAMRRRLALWGDDPQEFLGQLSLAGDHARSAVAQYDAALVVGQRAVQDAYAAAHRINGGDLSAWGGSREVAVNSLRDMLQVVATINGNAEALKASFGRGLRRAQFALDPADVANLMKLDGDQLTKALMETGADPQLLKRLAKPAMWQRLQDPAQWLLVNNLLWGWKTHVVNALGNIYMGAARPMERILGSFALHGDDGVRIRREAWRQYVYTGSSLVDGFQSAVKAWHQGDSILAPHSVESAVHQGINAATIPFKSPDNLTAILHNIGVAGMKVLGAPTRVMATIDEMTKQVVYRSKVMAEAHIQGATAGLDEAGLTAHVRKALLDAFDDAGRGTNQRAIEEAKIATFSQDLVGSVGVASQAFASTVPLTRLVIPFIKTPFNVLRYGQKLTPGLNLMQHEYRQMLSGKMGAEAQAQAVGQMSMGSLFLGAAAWLATSGFITGGGPNDPKLKKAAQQAGWQPYSFVSVGPDGKKTYRNFGKYDPIAMPLGIVADMVDAFGNWDDEASAASNLSDVATATLFGIVKMMGDKTYMKSLSDLVGAITEPENKFDKEASQLAVNFVPLASLLRMAKDQMFDQHMRDARTLADRVMAITPGLSDKVPPKRDMWGDPLTVSRGLWVTNEKDAVDAEVRRLATQTDHVMGPPSPTINGVDLRDIQMVNGRNAYDYYQDLAAHPSRNGRSLKETVAQIIQTPAYQRAPDGDAGTRGTRQAMLAGTMHRFRDMAARRLRADANVRAALFQKQKDVAAAYAASMAPKNPQTQGRESIGAIGQAFGVNLQGLMQ